MHLIALVLLVACTEPAPSDYPWRSRIVDRPTTIEDDGPTMEDVVAADLELGPAVVEAPAHVAWGDIAAAAVVKSKGGTRVDTSAEARKKFNPISVPQEGTSHGEWDWPFETRGRAIDLDGDGNPEVEGEKRAKFSELIDNEEDAADQVRRELGGR